MLKNILFATDLGPYTSHALAHVETLAKHFDAQVSLVHAVSPLSEFTNAIVKSYCSDDVKREVLETRNIRGILESVRDEVFDLVTANQDLGESLLERISDIVIVPGKAAPTILFEADRLRADLIVIGNHGVDALDDRVLGSVAAKVLQLAKVPVFLVPMLHQSVSGIQNDLFPKIADK